MKWKFCLATVIVLLMSVINAGAQSPRTARVTVIMPQVAPEDEHFSPQLQRFTIYAAAGKKRFKLRFLRHAYKSPSDKVGYVARYEGVLPPGRYTLSIVGNEDYLLPGFQVEAGETYTINVPIARLPLSGYACFAGKLLRDWEKDPDGKPVKAELFRTGGPFDISVHFCATERSADTLVYRPASVYYKDYFIAADEIEINRAKRTITATSKGLSDLIVLKGGVFADTAGTTFSIEF